MMNASLFRRSFLLLPLFVFVNITACKDDKQRNIIPSFYYWKSNFHLSALEQKTLENLSIKNLYIKFFDVEWDDISVGPRPVATLKFKDSIVNGIIFTPVVFITNETIQKSSVAQLKELAVNVVKLVSGIGKNNSIALSSELQIDCDWTKNTKDKYFNFLKEITTQPFLQNKKLSTTIRLHQLKFRSEAGIPPVSKGLLMCYNMGNLRNPAIANSIIDNSELAKYISNARTYSLPLDIALPLFDWYVWFHKNEYKGLVHNYVLEGIEKTKEKIIFNKDTIINGILFRKGDWLRHEESKMDVLKKAAKEIRNKISFENQTIILYHLDAQILKKYTNHELENLYNSFR